MNKKKKGLSVLALILLLLVITIGFSIGTGSFKILGTTTIGVPEWDVHFQNVNVITGSVSASTPPAIASDDECKISYAVSLAAPGNYYEFTVQIKNAGTLDAKLESAPQLSGVSTAQDVFVNYTLKYNDGTVPAAGDTLTAGQAKTIRVRVEYDPSTPTAQMPTTSQTLNLQALMNYVQA